MSRGATAAAAVMAALLLSHFTPLQAAQMLAPDADGYQLLDSAELYGPKYNYTDISTTGKLLTLADDGSIETDHFGFGFEFYGKTYYTAYVSANGYLSFGSSDNNYNPGRLSIPQPTGAPGWQTPPFVAPWFDDLDPSAGGAVYFDVLGDAPNRRVVVQWLAVHHDDPTAMFEFQVVLYESHNSILFQYRQTDAANTSLKNGASATAGIQGRDDAGINYPGPLTNNLAVGFVPAKYGYVGIPAGPQEQSGAPGQVVTYQVEVVNGKDVETDFKVELLSGARWQVAAPTSTGKIAPGKSTTLKIDVTVPATGTVAMADDIVSLRVTDKVEKVASSNPDGSSTSTQNNEIVDGVPVDATKVISSLIYLKTLCTPAPCFRQDSDGDGVPDSSEAASSVSDASKLHSLAVLSGETLNIEVTGGALHGFTMEEAVDGPENVEFAAGVFNYRIIPNRIADSVTVRFTSATAWSDQLVLYKVGSDGKYTEIDKDVKVEDKRWKWVEGDNAIELRLVDGGDLDEDGVMNGVIIDPLAIGLKVAPKETSSGFGSGGALFDELLLLTLLIGIRYAGWRSQRRLH